MATFSDTTVLLLIAVVKIAVVLFILLTGDRLYDVAGAQSGGAHPGALGALPGGSARIAATRWPTA